MFWLNTKKTDKRQAVKTGQSKKNSKAGSKSLIETSVGNSEGRRMTREEIQAQALANARAAREAIGEDTLQKIAAAIRKKEQSIIEQKKAEIKRSDAGRVASEISLMLDE